MTQAAVARHVHQALDVHRHFAAQITLDAIVAVDHFADLQHFVIGELVDAAILGDLQLGADLRGFGRADAVDVAQADRDPAYWLGCLRRAIRATLVTPCSRGLSPCEMPTRGACPQRGWLNRFLNALRQRASARRRSAEL